MKAFLLAFDLGTSALKAVVYGLDGHILASESRSYDHTSPHPGWAEADPKDWETAWHQCLEALSGIPHLLSEVEVVAFTGQMHTAVLLDKDKKPLSPTTRMHSISMPTS